MSRFITSNTFHIFKILLSFTKVLLATEADGEGRDHNNHKNSGSMWWTLDSSVGILLER